MAPQQNVSPTSSTSKVKLDVAQTDLGIAKAVLAAANGYLERAGARAPLRAQILQIHS
jgi:hypothetical protein